MIGDNSNNQEINIKVVYYGPALSGKTTNLEHIYSKLPPESKGKMVSMKTRTDRTLFFDFLPLRVEKVRGTTVKFLIYTVPGQVFYNATRKLVLNGVDAIVFVADSSPDKMDENRESLKNLRNNLSECGLELSDIPMVIQYNKRDLEGRLSIEELEREINESGSKYFEAVAVKGKGVYETFESIAREVFRKVREEDGSPGAPAGSAGEEQEEVKAEEDELSAPGAENIPVEIGTSEMDESESLNSAEERKEEQESVSEFVDQVLTENNDDDGELEFEGGDDDFKEYGHTVDLGDEQPVMKESGPEVAVEFINDPLDQLDRKKGRELVAEQPETEVEEASESITVPVRVSRERVERGDIRIVLELEID